MAPATAPLLATQPPNLGGSQSGQTVWIAAYPKTGSTWLKNIIDELMRSEAGEAKAVSSFHRQYPFDALACEVMGTRAKLLRTHSHPDHKMFQRLNRKPWYKAIGIITIRRHPLDVLLSQLNFAFLREMEAAFMHGTPKSAEEIIANGEIDYYIDRFVECGGCPEYLSRCGTYPNYYSAWREFSAGTPHLHLQYEGLVRKPLKGIKAVNSFLGLPSVNELEVARKVEMRSQLDGQFYWRKRAFNHRELLSRKSIERFEEGFFDHLLELGYDMGLRTRLDRFFSEKLPRLGLSRKPKQPPGAGIATDRSPSSPTSPHR